MLNLELLVARLQVVDCRHLACAIDRALTRFLLAKPRLIEIAIRRASIHVHTVWRTAAALSQLRDSHRDSSDVSLTQWCQRADIERALCLLVLQVADIAILVALHVHGRVLCDTTWCLRSHRSTVRSGGFARGGLLVAPPWRSIACVARLLLMVRWIKVVDLRSLEGRRVCNGLVEDGLLASLHRFIIVAQVVRVDFASLDLGVAGADKEGRFSRVS